MLILMVGLPGTGKSTLARALVAQHGGFIIDKDVIRPALFGPSQIEYTVEQDDFCQEIMVLTAEYLLNRKPLLRVFLDGRPFSREYQRKDIHAAAERIGTPLAVIECVASDQTALMRIARDLKAGTHLAANRTAELYYVKKRDFEREPLNEPRLTINSETELQASTIQANDYLTAFEQRFVPRVTKLVR
jgi:adenylylsulfate kinase